MTVCSEVYCPLIWGRDGAMQQHETHPVPGTPRKQSQSPQRCLRDGGRHVCDGPTSAIMESAPLYDKPWAPLLHDSPTSTMAPLESFARSCGTRQPRQDWVSLSPATSPLSAVTPPLPAASACRNCVPSVYCGGGGGALLRARARPPLRHHRGRCFPRPPLFPFLGHKFSTGMFAI